MAVEMESIIINVEEKGVNTAITSLSKLSTTLNKIGTSTTGTTKATTSVKQMGTALATTGTQAKAASSHVMGFFTKIGTRLATVLSVYRIVHGLSSAITKANEYVESYNLFTVALGEFADEAENYANRVSNSLGIDTAEWQRAQGTIMTLVTGFGVMEDRAYIMSKNLTQLGYDLSSFFNISVENAMLKIESGIAGELEPLRRLGYDLSQAKLEAVALSLGIDKAVSSMSQAEKAELRYYAILTQVIKAQGDMARTIDSPANQIRVLKAQFEMFARSIGEIFIPMLNKVLPYLIAFTRLMRDIAERIAKVFNFEMPRVEYEDVSTTTNQIADNLNDADKNAKKLKRTLLGFDEINRLNDVTDSSDNGLLGTGFDFELPQYDFLKGAVENKANEIYKAWKEKFDKILLEVKDFFNKVKALIPQDVIDEFKNLWARLKTIVEEVANSKAWATLKKWMEIISKMNFTALLAQLEAWLNFFDKLLTFIENPSWENYKKLVDSVFGVLVAFPTSILTQLDFKIRESNLPDWAKRLLHGVIKALKVSLNLVVRFGNPVAEIEYIKTLLEAEAPPWLKEIYEDLGKVKDRVSEFGNELKAHLQFVKIALTPVIDAVSGTLQSLASAFAMVRLSISTNFEEIKNTVIKAVVIIVKKFGEIRDKIAEIFSAIYEKWLAPQIEKIKNAFLGIATFIYENFIAPVIVKFEEFKTKLINLFGLIGTGVSEAIGGAVKSVLNNVFGAIEWWINNMVIKVINSPLEWLNNKLGTDIKPIEEIKLPRFDDHGGSGGHFASGGFPTTGQMFIAREAGPELVGTMGGHTAVANNEQITEGIYRAVLQAMRESGGNNGGDVTVVAQVDGKTLFKEVVRQNNMASRMYGRSPLSK